MILNVLLILCGVPLTKACLAMDPGDHISCPSVPQQTPQGPDDVNDYSGLSGPTTENGALVYTCKPPALMFEYDGTQNKKELPQDTKLSCKSNSGLFTLENNLDVKTKKFNCGAGDYSGCPEVPEAPLTIDKWYFPAELTGPKYVNGEMVYSCAPPDHMVWFESRGEGSGWDHGDLTEDTTISCKSKSNMFLVDGTENVGKKKYHCGSNILSCPEFNFNKDLPDNRWVKIDMVSFEAMENLIYFCPNGPSMYKVKKETPTAADLEKLPNESLIKCNRRTGELSYTNGMDEVPVDPTMTKFTCAGLPCQFCHRIFFVEPNSELGTQLCKDHTVITCKSKPIVVDDANMCPVVTCGGSDKLFYFDQNAATPVVDTTKVKCSEGWWQYADNMPLPNGNGFVCGELKTGG